MDSTFINNCVSLHVCVDPWCLCWFSWTLAGWADPVFNTLSMQCVDSHWTLWWIRSPSWVKLSRCSDIDQWFCAHIGLFVATHCFLHLVSSPNKCQPVVMSLFFLLSLLKWPVHEPRPLHRDAVSPHTPTYSIHNHSNVWVYRHTSAFVGLQSSLSFPGNLSPCKKTNGYLFKCYPQMRKYPSSSPHDDFPSKVSSRLEFSPHTPLNLLLHLSFSLSVPLFFIYFCVHLYRHTLLLGTRA